MTFCVWVREWVAAVRSSTTTQQCGSSPMRSNSRRRTAEQSGVEQDRIRNCTGWVCVCVLLVARLKSLEPLGTMGVPDFEVDWYKLCIHTQNWHCSNWMWRLNAAEFNQLIWYTSFAHHNVTKISQIFCQKLLYYKSAFLPFSDIILFTVSIIGISPYFRKLQSTFCYIHQ